MAAIVTLTPSPAVDVSTSVRRLAPVHKLRCGPARRDPGGGGVNVARVIQRLGGDVLAVYASGGPTGELLDRLLTHEGVPTRPVPTAQDTRENFYIVEQDTGLEFKFILPGPELDAPSQAACIEALGLAGATPPAYVVCSGGLPPGVAVDFYARVVRAARQVGVRVVVDSHGPALAAAAEEGVYLIKPSLRELEELVGRALPTASAQLDSCVDLIARGGAELVALSLGEQGALLVGAEDAWRGHAPRVEALSSVGAGDSFLAGLLLSLSSGAPHAAALRQAIAAGAAALLAPGTGLCTPGQMAQMASAIHVEQLVVPVAAAVN